MYAQVCRTRQPSGNPATACTLTVALPSIAPATGMRASGGAAPPHSAAWRSQGPASRRQPFQRPHCSSSTKRFIAPRAGQAGQVQGAKRMVLQRVGSPRLLLATHARHRDLQKCPNSNSNRQRHSSHGPCTAPGRGRYGTAAPSCQRRRLGSANKSSSSSTSVHQQRPMGRALRRPPPHATTPGASPLWGHPWHLQR